MIHREGYAYCTGIVVLTIAAAWITYPLSPGLWYATLVIMLALCLAIFQFFRNPARPIPLKDEQIIYAPADGKIVVIEKTMESEYLKNEAIQVSIFMSPINVHVNRIPISGKISYVKYHPGKYLVAWDPKSSTENERTTLAIDSGKKTIVLRQIAGALARRIRYYVQEGQMVSQGEEFGFIKFGSRVDVFLPLESQILVKVGQKVYGNITEIARVPHK